MLVHGLEGSSESPYRLGIAEKAFEAGFNVLRLNQRNCGGTEHLTPTLQNSGPSSDYRSVLEELINRDDLPEVFFARYSVGGNLVLKMARELGPDAPPEFRAVGAVSPCVDLASSSNGSGLARNFVYEWYFLRGLRNTREKKVRLFGETLPSHGGAEGPEPAGLARSGDRPGGGLPECRRILPTGERAS